MITAICFLIRPVCSRHSHVHHDLPLRSSKSSHATARSWPGVLYRPASVCGVRMWHIKATELGLIGPKGFCQCFSDFQRRNQLHWSHDTPGKCFGSSVSFRHGSFWNLTHYGGIYLLLANYWKSSQNMSRLKTETFEGIHGWFVYLPKWNIALNHYPITTRVQRIF